MSKDTILAVLLGAGIATLFWLFALPPVTRTRDLLFRLRIVASLFASGLFVWLSIWAITVDRFGSYLSRNDAGVVVLKRYSCGSVVNRVDLPFTVFPATPEGILENDAYQRSLQDCLSSTHILLSAASWLLASLLLCFGSGFLKINKNTIEFGWRRKRGPEP